MNHIHFVFTIFCLPDLSIIQAVLDSAVNTPAGIKTSEDLGLLKSSMSFNDLLVASSDKAARMEPLSLDLASTSAKRKLDELLPGDAMASNKKAQLSRQSKRNSALKSVASPEVTLDTASEEKNDVKKTPNTPINKVVKEKNATSPRVKMESTDAPMVISSSHAVIASHVDSMNVPQAARVSMIPPQGDTNLGKAKVVTAVFPVPADGEKSAIKAKLTTASLPVVNLPRLSTYASQSAQPAAHEMNVKAEDNFKGVAKAAVLNLIQNACNAKVTSGNSITEEDSDSEDSMSMPSFQKPVNTSTAHVHALTSANWMNACSSSALSSRSSVSDQAPLPSGPEDPLDAKLARSRRASLSADERANLNRDRNREHARNTRLRKKAYVEELKKTLTDLVTQRDASELEKRHEKQRDLEVREVRFRVMEEFLKLRSRGSEANLLARWIAILEDGFTLTLPRTDYRQMVGPKVVLPNQSGLLRSSTDAAVDGNPPNPSVQVLKGALECMDDAFKLHHFVNSIGRMGSGRSQNSVKCNFTCDKSNFMMDGVNAFLEWSFATSGATQKVSILVIFHHVPSQ